jgi:hypothetical protein
MKILPAAAPISGVLTARWHKQWAHLVRVFESAAVSYPLLLVLQLKVIWGLWVNRDVTVGDTTSYFLDAWRWYTTGEVNIVWSPLYTAFYGSFLYLNPDAVWVTFAHRMVIVLVAAGLVLAVFRQILTPSVAWLCAAWWAVLPIVFNTLYEVHLFAVIPILISWLLIFTSRGPWRRAMGLGVMGLSVILVRNELSVPFVLLSIGLAGFELRRLRRNWPEEPYRITHTLIAYIASLAIAVGMIVVVYQKSYVKYPEITIYLKGKHTVNMAQVYSFGYQQRNPEWNLSPWVEYHDLMQEHFGQPLLSLREMMVANPRAVAEHFAWNWSLTPSGLQLLLFNRASGSINPDYDHDVHRRLNSSLAMGLSLGLIAIWTVGLMILWKTRRAWIPHVTSGQALGWLAMLAVAAVVPLIIMTQRPRPSYLFSFLVLLIAFTGLCFSAAAVRWNGINHLRAAMPLIMIGLVILVPRYYSRAYGAGHPQVVAKVVQRLAPHRDAIDESSQRLAVPYSLAAWYAYPMIRFADTGEQKRLFETYWLLSQIQAPESFSAVLDRFKVNVLYLDEWTLNQIEARNLDPEGHFTAASEVPGWRLIDVGNQPGDRWRLYCRRQHE